MIQPHELKRAPFTKAVRGYNPAEVDEYIEFLIDKYTQLYKENSELERKLHVTSSKYEEIAASEESIRSAVLKAQKLSEAIVSNARKKADEIVFTVEDRCKQVLDENTEKLETEKKRLAELRKLSIDFRNSLYSQYLEHVKTVRDMPLPSPETVEEDLNTALAMKVRAMDGLEPQKQVYEASEAALNEAEPNQEQDISEE